MQKPTAFLVLALCLAPLPAHAGASDWQRDEAVGVRLVSGVNGVGQNTTVPLGLEVDLAPEWHTYWRSPGMAGLPPQIDWQNSTTDSGNLQSAELLYPAPRRYTAYGLEAIGYRDHVVFPIDARLRVPGKALDIDATLNLLVCSAICVPKTFELKLTVPQGEATESPEAPLIKQFRDALPGDAEKSGLLLKDVANHGDALVLTFESRDLLDQPDVFIEDDNNIAFAAPVVDIDAQKHRMSLTVKPADTLPEGQALAGMPLTLTVINDGDALEQKITVPPMGGAGTKPVLQGPGISFAFALLLAILGGFILNLMPCVLPVLSMKILSVASHGGGEKRIVRHSFFVTAGGIVFSYLVLGLVTILLKTLGLTFGWGVQFQQPLFLVGLVILLTLFAANMWGLFEIRLPQWIADNLDTSYHPKLAGDFLTGAFATLLSTPCSAPFLGTAVGFALAAGPWQIVAIFLALGLGMSLPYLAVAAWPGFATALPKPGAWMVWLRHILGTALALTAFWLVWILMAQIPPRFAVLVGLCMAGIVIMLALRKTGVSRRFINIGLTDFALVALAVTLAGSFVPKEKTGVDKLWIPMSETEIDADISEGKTVFVDITADWCLTCKANMKFVLTRGAVEQRLFHDDVIAMQGDWTNPDPLITDFLHKYGRYGIPFNVVFGPGAPQGIVLPELLSSEKVMDALDKAAGRVNP